MSNTTSSDTTAAPATEGRFSLSEIMSNDRTRRVLNQYINPETLINIAISYAMDRGIDFITDKFKAWRSSRMYFIQFENDWGRASSDTYYTVIRWVYEHMGTRADVLRATQSGEDGEMILIPCINHGVTIDYKGASITFTFGKNDHRSFVSAAVEEKHRAVLDELFATWKYVPPAHDMIPIYTYDAKENQWAITNYKRRRPLESMSYPPEVINGLMERTKFWRDNKKWYYDNYVMWKQNNLVHGPGGTGKSTLALVLATMLDFGIAQLALGEHSDNTFKNAIASLPKNVVLTIEDGDVSGAFNRRKNYTDNASAARVAVASDSPPAAETVSLDGTAKPLSNAPANNSDNTGSTGFEMMFRPIGLDTVLNVLQGIDTPDGLFSVITSNTTNFDHAILREGRMDTVTYLGDMHNAEIRDYIHKKYPELKIPAGTVFQSIRGSVIEDIATRTAGHPDDFLKMVYTRSNGL